MTLDYPGPKLSQRDSTLLEKPLRDSKVIQGIKALSWAWWYPLPLLPKLLGHHGVKTIFFYKEVFRTNKMEPKMNKTLLCLVPKMVNASTIKNFRPIGLCNTSYKLVTKIIVNMLKPFLPLIIGLNQASFLSNRRASDNAIVVQEFSTHFTKIKGKVSSMITENRP